MADARPEALDALDPHAAAALLAIASDITLVLSRRGVVESVAFSAPEQAIDGSEEWVGKHFADIVSSDTKPKAESLLTEVGTRGVSRRRQLNHPGADGAADIPVQYAILRLGRADRLIATGRDLRTVSTLQQRLVEAQQSMERDYWKLRHIETRYRLLFQLAGEAILVLDAQSLRVVDANQAAGTMFGEAAERLQGRVFPFGVSRDDVRAVEDVLSGARASGRAAGVPVRLVNGNGIEASATTFRQDAQTLVLVRLVPSASTVAANAAPALKMLDLLQQAPDAFVVTDLDGKILLSNPAFLDLAQLATEEQAKGEPIGNWIGRPGADLPVFLAMLRRHGAVRLMATAAKGAHGSLSEVEVSAAWVPEAEQPCVGFIIRDVGRRLAAGPQGARDLTRAVEQLTGLVGRTSLRELVRDTVDLVERHFIEAALEMTQDNRTSAAEVLGLSRQSLYVKLRRHRLLGPIAGPDVEPPDDLEVVG